MYNEIIYLSGIASPPLIVHYDKAKKINGINHVLTECAYCKQTQWRKAYSYKTGHTKTTFCEKHIKLSQIRWGTSDDNFLKNPDIIVDLQKQRLIPLGAKIPEERNQKQRGVEIWVTCPDCKEQRWTLINGLRNNNLTTLCKSCAAKRSRKHGPEAYNWAGGIQITNYGYIMLHTHIIQEKYGAEVLDYITTYLKPHRNYLYEHKIIALLTYGEQSIEPGIVVRHINGDKQDNRPENLELGRQSDNIQDHVLDRKELKLWKGIALSLLRILIAKN